MPNTKIPILDDAAIARLEALPKIYTFSADIDALCNTVRALRYQLDLVEKAFELEGALRLSEVGDLNTLQIIKKLTALQSQLEQVTKERDRFSELADKRHDELCTARRQRDDLAAKCAPYLEQLK